MPFNLRGPELLVLFILIAVIAGVVLLVVVLAKAASRPSIPKATANSPRPAGWYPVPDGSGRVAWWDGEKWIDNSPPS